MKISYYTLIAATLLTLALGACTKKDLTRGMAGTQIEVTNLVKQVADLEATVDSLNGAMTDADLRDSICGDREAVHRMLGKHIRASKSVADSLDKLAAKIKILIPEYAASEDGKLTEGLADKVEELPTLLDLISSAEDDAVDPASMAHKQTLEILAAKARLEGKIVTAKLAEVQLGVIPKLSYMRGLLGTMCRANQGEKVLGKTMDYAMDAIETIVDDGAEVTKKVYNGLKGFGKKIFRSEEDSAK